MPGEPESVCGCCKQVCASHGCMHAWPAKNCAVSEIFLLVSSIGWVTELSKEVFLQLLPLLQSASCSCCL